MAEAHSSVESAGEVRHGYQVWLRERTLAASGWIRIVVGGNWSVVVSSILAGLAVISVGVDRLGAKGIVAVIAGIGLVPVVSDWIKLRRDLHALHPVESPLPDVGVPDGWEVRRYSRGRMITNELIDESLGRQQPISYEAERYRLPPELAAVKNSVVAYARVTRPRDAPQPFDGAAVRLCTDLDPSGGTVHLQRTGYFDVLTSDYLAGYQWRGRDLRAVADVSRSIVDREGRLVSLADSDLVHEIGVSTLAMTSDGWMILVVQGGSARSSPGLLAPTGSGTMEPIDLHGRFRLVDAVAAGMERELREENGLHTDVMRAIRIETEVLGFGRWLEKGAKPEFFGFSRIYAPIRRLDLRIDLSERPYVAGHLRIPPPDVRSLLKDATFDDLGHPTPSVPLEACLAGLRRLRATGGLTYWG